MLINDERTTITGEKPIFTYANDEKETILNYDYENKIWNVWTNVTSHITKILKLNCINTLEIESVNENGTITAIKAIIREKGISFRNEMSEEQKEKARMRYKERNA